MSETEANAAALYPPTVAAPPRPLPLLRYLARFVRNPLAVLPQQVYEEPLVVYGRNRSLVVWVTDPGLTEIMLLRDSQRFPKTLLEQRVLGPMLGQGILTSEGEAWRWQRKLAAPLFRHGEILTYVPVMVAAAEAQLARWRTQPQGLVAIDRDMTETTFEVISRTILAGCDKTEGEIIQHAGQDFLEPISWEIAYVMMGVPAWVWHPGKGRMLRAATEERAAVARIVARRRAEKREASDILGRLLQARRPETGEPMSDDQMVDNLTTFLAAGHETTAKALIWTLYLLARAPEWQERVRAEVRTVVGDRPIAAGDIDQLALTTQVIKESMRLYPPAPILSRLAAEDLVLGGTAIKRGTLMIIPIFVVHRHRKLWTAPDRFDPERFAPDREADYARTQFMPFGFGPRTCIGAAFAMIEATALLATFVRGARFEWDGRHAPEPISRVTLRPKGGMPLKVTALN